MSCDVRHIIWDGDGTPASDPSVGRGVGTGGGAWSPRGGPSRAPRGGLRPALVPQET